MREVVDIYEAAFVNGLALSDSLSEKAEFLSYCLNMIPNDFGLVSRPIITVPSYNLSGQSYPFPIYKACINCELLIVSNGIYLIDQYGTQTFIISNIISYNTLPVVADFINYIVISIDRKSWIVNTISKEVSEFTSKASINFSTSTNFRGQLIVGNGDIINRTDCELGNIHISSTFQTNSMIAWSKIGKFDFTLDLSNESGYTYMPQGGDVYAILSLSNKIVVYGDRGIIKLTPVDSPAVTFAVEIFGSIGLLGKNCVAGDLTNHLFIGQDFELYIVELEKAFTGEGRTPKKIGYSYLIKTLVNPIVTFDEVNRLWYIGDDKKCFIFNGKTLSNSGITPTCITNKFNVPMSFIKDLNGNRYKLAIETGPISLGSHGLKTLMCVETNIDNPQKVYGEVLWQADYKKGFRGSKKILLNPRGNFFPIVSGTDFKISLTSNNFQDFKLSKLWLKFKNTDKTSSRGIINAGRPAE